MSAPQYLVQAALSRLGARVGSGLADTAATLAVLAQDAPRRLKEELDLFREEVELEAERLERRESVGGPAATSGGSGAGGGDAGGPDGDPQEQIDALRARVAELSRRLDQRPGGS